MHGFTLRGFCPSWGGRRQQPHRCRPRLHRSSPGAIPIPPAGPEVCFLIYLKLCWDAAGSRAAQGPSPAFPGAGCAYGPRVTPLWSQMPCLVQKCSVTAAQAGLMPIWERALAALPPEGVNPGLHCSKLHGSCYGCTAGAWGGGAIPYRRRLFFQQCLFCICLLLLLLLMCL